MADLQAITAWLTREGRLLLTAATSRGLWLCLAAGLALWTLAYQLPAGHTLHIGGDTSTRLRKYDAPFLTGFNASEPEPAGGEWYESGARPYRWTEGEAEVLLPGMGGGAWVLRVAASAGPRPEAVTSLWQLMDAAPVAVAVAPGDPRVYHLLGAAPSGDVRLGLSTPPLAAPGDPRSLGLVLYRVDAASAADFPRPPAPTTLALLAAAAAGLYTLVYRLIGATTDERRPTTHGRQPTADSRQPPPDDPRPATDSRQPPPDDPRPTTRDRATRHVGRWLPSAITLAFVLLAAWMLAARRADLTIFAPALAALVWSCIGLVLLLAPLLGATARALGVSAPAWERGAVLGAVIAAFATRMGGVLHPYALFSDLGLNVNRLRLLARGQVFLTAGLPCEAGAGEAPYPPGQYLTLAPAKLLLGDEALDGRLIQGSVALLESCGAAIIWLLLRRAGVGRAAALLGAALYAAAPPLLRSYSVGEMANLFAQALLLPLLLFLTLAPPRARRAGVAAVGGTLLAMLLLSHTGASISVAALLAAWLPLWWLVRAKDDPQPTTHNPRPTTDEVEALTTAPNRAAALRSLVLAGAVAAAFAGSLYYSGYLGLLEARRAQAAAQAALPPADRCPPERPLVAKLLGWGLGPLVDAQPALQAPLLAAGAGGALLLLGRRGRGRELGIVLAACWLGALLSLGTLLGS
ncbi:MAG: hypothetical protein RLZZ387_360, partial [Chloroflexota bacterium]